MPIKTVMVNFPTMPLEAVDLSPDGRWLLCTSRDSLKLWNLDGEVSELTHQGRGSEEFCTFFTSPFSLDSRRLACAIGGNVQLWEIDKLDSDDAWEVSKALPVIREVGISPDGQKFSLSTSSRDLQIWDIEEKGSHQLPHSIQNVPGTRGGSHGFSADGQVLAFSGPGLLQRKDAIYLWDLRQKLIIRTLTSGEDERSYFHAYLAIDAIRFSSDSQLLLGGCSIWNGDGSHLVWVWDLGKETAGPFKTFKRSSGGLMGKPVEVALSPQNRYLVASIAGPHDTFGIEIWDFDTCEAVRSIHVSGSITILKFSEEGDEIITDRGVFPIIEHMENGEPSTAATKQYSSLLVVRDGWIVRGAQRRLWLPSEERGVWASHGESLYIGTKSGRLQKYVVRDDTVEELEVS